MILWSSQILWTSLLKTVIIIWVCLQSNDSLDLFNSSSSLQSFNSASRSWQFFSDFSRIQEIVSPPELLVLFSLCEPQLETLSWASLLRVSESHSKDFVRISSAASFSLFFALTFLMTVDDSWLHSLSFVHKSPEEDHQVLYALDLSQRNTTLYFL